MQRYSLNQIIPILITIAGLGVAVMMGRWVASGSIVMPGLIIGAIFGTVFFLTLGRLYWYMIPFALASGLPAIPLGGRTIELGELFVAACTAIFFARIAMKKEQLVLFRASHVPLLLCFAWICMVWALHPTGFIFLGSEMMGGRYYLKIVLGFFAFLVMASQQPDEKDFLRIIYLVFFGVVLKTGYGLFSFFVLGGGGEADMTSSIDDEYSWHQILAGPAVIGTYYLFARYKPSEIFSFQRPWAIALYGGAIVLAMLSGKRMGLMLTLATPFFSAVLFREYKHFLIAATLGAIGIGTLVMGQGQIFHLPYTAQRALSWLPGDWEPSLKRLGSSDIFRKELRELAVEEIQKNPLVGRGYATAIEDVITGMNLQRFGTGQELEKTWGAAISKNWHNTWLGYSADFGIPFMVLHGFLLLTVLTLSFQMARSLPHPSTRQIFCVYAFFSVSAKIIMIHTSGHTALDAFNNWWLFGLLFAVAAQVRMERLQANRQVFETRIRGEVEAHDGVQ